MGANEVVQIATAQVGKPYVWDTAGPNTFDCSGLVVYAFKHGANLDLPHYTGSLYKLGSSVTRSELAPGDLIFPNLGHVQIYIGNGKVVEAPHTGANVRIVSLGSFFGARRIIAPGTAAAAAGPNGSVIPVGLNPFSGADKLAAFFTDPVMWRRVGFILFGSVLLIMGTLLMTVGSLPGPATAVKLASKVVK